MFFLIFRCRKERAVALLFAPERVDVAGARSAKGLSFEDIQVAQDVATIGRMINATMTGSDVLGCGLSPGECGAQAASTWSRVYGVQVLAV